jgi:hypothetical protein
MAITREYGAVGGTNPTTSTTVTIPAGCTTGDILILAATNRGATADPSVTDNDVGGNAWAKIANRNAATNGAGTVWWKRATSGTASKTITVSGMTNSMTCVLAGFRGASKATIPYKAASGEANASGDESHAAYTTDRAGSMVILTVHDTSNDTNNPTSYTATDPTTLAESGEHTSSGGLDCSTSLAYAIKSTAGSTGTINWAQTNGTSASIVFELYPAWDNLVADSGSFTLSGTAATLKRALKLTADSGAYTESGTAASLLRGLKLVAGGGTYTETGTAATLKRGLRLTAGGGSYSISGTAATLSYSGESVGARSGSAMVMWRKKMNAASAIRRKKRRRR